ncbi:phage tail protein [Klebsiella pneumoniae]|uniref:phage tail protein n=1 Tax=Klebsiella quasipneumoniae TaxID=1463165 RepID=UPI0027EFCD9F|nr:immunoglobulin domain-containing protein [Klebsiella pneumoniae]HBQ6202357.1 immunoglobulin domain-containing protein [Klebsiella variicola subsp. variicola]HDU4902896.1 immunoglobulin domain-containing protein [Klebsiella quasipneumoniae subsp. similipneumoniae]HBQ6509275.1 immunoglobulin domain-containing protein [Klebsiella variicola subsp. variicola]HBS7048089.1 immunoglobulin domain-containing protein [Klebsiella pneumoniae]
MSALFERAQKTKIMITSVPVTADEMASATWLELSCTIKQASFTAGQKNDIDVTTLCSDETENINGLPAPSEMSLSGNFYRNPAQDALRAAYDNDGIHGFKVIFPSGNGSQFRAEVRQHTWDSQTNGVVAATFSLRLKGKAVNIDAPGVLSFATDLPASQTVAAGSALTMGVVVQGGTAPYTYVWKKGSSTVSGQTSATFTKASAVSGDAGVYSCVVTDADGTVINSSDCTVTIN